MASDANPLATPAATPAATTTGAKILSAISSIGGYATVAVTLEGVIAPLVVLGIKAIKGLVEPGQTIDFSVELTAEQAALLNAITEDIGDGALINAELTRQGQPALTFPPPAAPAPDTGPVTS